MRGALCILLVSGKAQLYLNTQKQPKLSSKLARAYARKFVLRRLHV